jgi:hypothetical protein
VDVPDLLKASQYESWLPEYLNRGRLLQERLSAAVTSALEDSQMDFKAALGRLRQMRTDFTPRFCLFLHPTGVNTQWADVLANRYGSDAVKTTLADPPDVPRILTIVLVLLHLNAGGLHLVLLERPDDSGPREDGPLRIPAPNEIWEPSFQALAELSHAFIAVAGFSVGLQAEINYLADQGLDGRLLITRGRRLYWRDPSTRKRKSWHLAVLHRAVAHASAQPIRLVHGDGL